MNERLRAAATAAALCTGAACVPAPAGEPATIYRCGAGAAYSDRPCADGQPLTVDVDRPDADRQAEARDVAGREARLAQTLERERHARDTQPAAAAAGFHASGQPPAAAEAKAQRGPKKPHAVRLPAAKKKRVGPPPEGPAPALRNG